MALKSDILIRRIPLTLLDVRIFGQALLKLGFRWVLLILTHTISYCFCSFTSFHHTYRKCLFFCYFFTFLYLFSFSFFFKNSLSTGYFYFLYVLWSGRLLYYPPQKIFSSNSSSCYLPACFIVFIHVQLLLRTLFLFTLVQSFRKLKLYKRLFVDCLHCNVTELLPRNNCKIVYLGKFICRKDASEEGQCQNTMQNIVCSFCPLITQQYEQL